MTTSNGKRPSRTVGSSRRAAGASGMPPRVTARAPSGPSRPTARAATRPAPAARGREEAPPRPTDPGTARRRWAVLGAILVVLAITLVPTARSLGRQRAEIAALRERVATQQADVEALQAEQARWQDPAYVEQQARERLKFVKVGDRSYTVLDPAETERTTPAGATVAAPKADPDVPWYGRLWQSVRLADQPTAGLVPVSATR